MALNPLTSSQMAYVNGLINNSNRYYQQQQQKQTAQNAVATGALNGIRSFTVNNPVTPSASTSTTTPAKATTTGSTSGMSDYLSQLSAMYSQQAAARQAALEAAYSRAKSQIEDSYGQTYGLMQDNYNAGVNALRSSYNNSLNSINNDANRSLKESYVNKMLSQKNLNQKMAAQGLSGGATETSLAGLLNNYGNSRNNIETTRNDNLSTLNANNDANMASLLQNYNSNLANIQQQRASALSNIEMALASGLTDAMNQQYSFQGNMINNVLSTLLNNAAKIEYAQTMANNKEAATNTQQADATSINTSTNYDEYIKMIQALLNQ